MTTSESAEAQNVTLAIEDKLFTVNKSILCEYSDYFRAMFSGSYIENSQEQIKIDVVDAKSMETIVQYMNIGLTDLTELSLSSMGELALASNFLQIKELLKQIEYTLELKLSHSNWIDIKTIAEEASFSHLEKYASAFGLLNFESMKPEHIPTIANLYWYLSHPYLNTNKELHVFKFGLEWISTRKLPEESILIVLGCLYIQSLTVDDLTEMELLMRNYEGSLSAKVINLLHVVLTNKWDMSSTVLEEHKKELCKQFSESVYNETIDIIRDSRRREQQMIPCICAWKTKEPDSEPHYLYQYKGEFERWVQVAQRSLWGWSITSWGPHKLVVSGGEHGKGTGNFHREVAIYDTLKNEWTRHGVQLPPHRHAAVIVHNDQLFIVGGVGAFRVVLQSTIVYDLEQRSFRNMATLPDVIQNPAICIHNGQVHVASHSIVHKYTETADSDEWTNILSINVRANYMVSMGEYIYITQSFFGHLYRFRPGIDTELELYTYFSNPIAAICKVGTHIMAFTQTACGQRDRVTVEEYRDGKTNVLWTQDNGPIRFNEVAGCCALVMSMPPPQAAGSPYPKKYLKKILDADPDV